MRELLRRNDGERGATMVEFALVFVLLLAMALGTFEYGMALRDWVSVTIATREGARVAASAANYEAADCVILEATSGALQSFRSGEISRVHIYRSDGNGSYPDGNSTLAAIYRPAASGDTPVPECPFWTVHNPASNWEPGDRTTPPGGEPHWIGVRLEYTHDWRTDFLWWSGTAAWQDDAVFKIEPPPPNA